MSEMMKKKRKKAAKKLKQFAFWGEVLQNKKYKNAPLFGLHCEPSCSGGPHGCHCQ